MKYPDDYIDKIILGNCFDIMKDIPDNAIDLIITSPPFIEEELLSFNEKKDYYEVIKDFISLSMKKSKWMFMFNSSKRMIDLCRLTNPRFILIWNKKFTLSPFKYEPIFLYTQDPNESIWGRGKIFTTCLSYSVKLKNKEHINENPIKLYETLIKLYKKAEIILDPFLGSGTSIIAAKKLGKHYIGIDINPTYCEIARKRILEET